MKKQFTRQLYREHRELLYDQIVELPNTEWYWFNKLKSALNSQVKKQTLDKIFSAMIHGRWP